MASEPAPQPPLWPLRIQLYHHGPNSYIIGMPETLSTFVDVLEPARALKHFYCL
jgi:hypothetical protein